MILLLSIIVTILLVFLGIGLVNLLAEGER